MRDLTSQSQPISLKNTLNKLYRATNSALLKEVIKRYVSFDQTVCRFRRAGEFVHANRSKICFKRFKHMLCGDEFFSPINHFAKFLFTAPLRGMKKFCVEKLVTNLKPDKTKDSNEHSFNLLNLK